MPFCFPRPRRERVRVRVLLLGQASGVMRLAWSVESRGASARPAAGVVPDQVLSGEGRVAAAMSGVRFVAVDVKRGMP